jgi:hypothetical protein
MIISEVNDSLYGKRMEEPTKNAILKHSRYDWLKNPSYL